MFAIPLLATTVWKGVKGFFSAISLKQWMYFGLALFIAFGLWSAYKWAYERGSHSRDPEVAQLTDQLQTVTRQRDELRQAFVQWKADTKAAETQWQNEQDQILQDLRQQLADANARAAQRRIEYREIVKYISNADDAACTLPVNALLLHNWSIEGEPPGALNQLSQTAPGVQSAPSSLRLSEYIAVAQHNNSEAVRRGEVIQQWEAWYESSYKAFTAALQRANIQVNTIDGMVPAPPSTEPVSPSSESQGASRSESPHAVPETVVDATTATQAAPAPAIQTGNARNGGVPLPDYTRPGE